MSTLILLVIAAFAPPEAWIAAMIAFGIIIYIAGFFYAPYRVWVAALMLVPLRLAMGILLNAPGAENFLLAQIVPKIAAVAECVTFVILAVLAAAGFILRRSIAVSAYYKCQLWFQDRKVRK